MAIAIFTTWTTYGTWLPGDERGWYKSGAGVQSFDRVRLFEASLLLGEDAMTLDSPQRELVEKTIGDHCAIRAWDLLAVNCRTNHVHVVVSAPGVDIGVPRQQFKAWCTRKLRAAYPELSRSKWWTERGWDEHIDDDRSLADVMEYVLERQ